ncbi:MAG: CT253 family lipoprotein [Rhabdochlamydiaceae bacterium]
MRSWKHSIWACALFLGGCSKGANSTAVLIEQPVTTRPIVTIAPVFDRSHHELSWNISHELTAAIRQRLTQYGHLYLLSEDQVYAMTRRLPQGHDPFGLETAWVKKGYPQNEFVAFFELIDHREVPLLSSKSNSEEGPAQLNVSMRVRVFDLRGDVPNVVLEEIVEQSHHIPRQFTRNQFNQVPWGDEMFEISPLGIAHEKLCQELASRVEDYILLNCKS